MPDKELKLDKDTPVTAVQAEYVEHAVWFAAANAEAQQAQQRIQQIQQVAQPRQQRAAILRGWLLGHGFSEDDIGLLEQAQPIIEGPPPNRRQRRTAPAKNTAGAAKKAPTRRR